MATKNAQSELEALKAELAKAKAELESAKGKASRAFSLKVSEKGGVSVYGLGRFPVTLYQEQWDTLFAHQDEVKEFIEANRPKLKKKGQ